MHLQITTAGRKERNEIDRFLLRRPDGLAYHRFSWLEAVKSAYGHDFIYLIARESERIVGILPLCIFKGITGKGRFCSLPFCDVGGTIAGSNLVGQRLIEEARARMKQLGCCSIELRQRSCDAGKADLTNRKVSMVLDLPGDPETLMKNFKAKLRSQINKAARNGLVFDFGNDDSSIIEFNQVYSKNMHALGSPVHSPEWFMQLRKGYGDDFLVGKVYLDRKVVGAGILMFAGENVSIPWASTLRQYNRLAPNMMLYSNLLNISIERECKVFDFGRSTYMEGTYKFKEQWGAKPIALDWYSLDDSGQKIETTPESHGFTRKTVESIWKFCPLAMTNFLGPRLRKYISL